MSFWEAAFWVYVGAWSGSGSIAALVVVLELRRLRRLLEYESRARRFSSRVEGQEDR